MGDAAVGALAVPARALPGVPMATSVDPLTAIERDHIACVAFAAWLNKTDGRKSAQEKGGGLAGALIAAALLHLLIPVAL